MSVNIIWEDAGYNHKEYRGMGLFGYYDCFYVKMDYKDEVLHIDSSDTNKIIKVYLP
jgi:hypothetical protein